MNLPPRDEFAAGAQEWPGRQSRREFLLRTAATLALANAACRQPRDEVVPATGVDLQEHRFATAVTRGGLATGVLVTTDGPRPRRLDGNPAHPAGLGGIGPIEQAAILGLYDPYCSGHVLHGGARSDWSAFGAAVAALGPDTPVRILTGRVTSPTLAWQLGLLLRQRPGSRWHRYEPVHDDGARSGSMAAFGRFADVLLRPERARVVLALDGDPLAEPPGAWAQARAFAAARRPGPDQARWYAVESTPTPFGIKADHRLPLARSAIAPFARELARAVGATSGSGAPLPEPAQVWVAAAARDLQRQRGRSLVTAGRGQPAEVHALVHRINHALGNLGSTVLLIEPVEADPVLHGDSLRDLAAAMGAGEVPALFVLGSNPVYAAAAGVDFATLLQRVPFCAHLGREADETAAACTWHVPMAHELESWGDCRAHDGTVTIQQPLIEPLAGGRTPCQLLALVLGQGDVPAKAPLLAHWRERGLGADFAAGWRSALQSGHVPGSARAPLSLEPVAEQDGNGHGHGNSAGPGVELAFEPHAAVWDGTFAGNPWLQELPDAITSLTWGNAALFSPALAAKLGVADGDEVELAVADRRQRAGVLVVTGQADGCITVHLGQGRRGLGLPGAGCGFSAYALRGAPWSVRPVQVTRTGMRRPLARTQPQQEEQGHHPLRELAAPPPAPPFREVHPSLYPEPGGEAEHAWGMAIDLQACIGCNACVIGCQAENNVPVVGEAQVAMGRVMHWLRVDHYRLGPDGHGAFEPMACQHCENAPCETVCPVGATLHSKEGLNEMVYNRCIGTRYCSNNCAWKVRRFNFLAYGEQATAGERAQRNRQVTVRARGVMEKCTYCVQRIEHARIAARREDRPMRDGEVVTACQAVCPTEAIVFGDLRDPHSKVNARKADPRDFLVLGHLNTRPRTSYGALVSNRNPELLP